MSPIFLLTAGLAMLALAGALSQFVIIGLPGLVFFPAGFFLAACGLSKAQADAVTYGWAAGSILASWSGLMLVTISAFLGGNLAFATRVHHLPSALQQDLGGFEASWLPAIVVSLMGASLLEFGLRHYPTCSLNTRLGWLYIAAAVFPAAALMFFVISAIYSLAN
jgi:hypothetical protein